MNLSQVTILHGDNSTATRNKVGEFVSQANQEKTPLYRLEGKNCTYAALEQLLATQSLFTPKRLIILSGLLTGPASKAKTSLVNLICTYAQNPDFQDQIVVWEEKKLTAAQIKLFAALQPQPTILENKASSALFAWLDALNGSKSGYSRVLKLQHDAFTQDGEFLCLSMLARQTRMLIAAKENEPIAGPPFMIQKLKKQAQTFNLSQLITLHVRLAELDVLYKSSSPLLGIAGELDLLILGL